MDKKKPKLSKKSQHLIDSLDDDAQRWGWESDQGVGADVDRAEKHWKESKAELEAHVLKLEQRIKTLTAKKD